VKEHTTIAVDLSKSVFELAVSRKPGGVCQRVRLSRSQMTRFFAGRPPATVLLEACGSSARNQRGKPSLQERGVQIRHVRRLVPGNSHRGVRAKSIWVQQDPFG